MGGDEGGATSWECLQRAEVQPFGGEAAVALVTGCDEAHQGCSKSSVDLVDGDLPSFALMLWA